MRGKDRASPATEGRGDARHTSRAASDEILLARQGNGSGCGGQISIEQGFAIQLRLNHPGQNLKVKVATRESVKCLSVRAQTLTVGPQQEIICEPAITENSHVARGVS